MTQDPKHQVAIDQILALARELSQNDISWAATYLTIALVFLDVQIGDTKDAFLEMVGIQWDIMSNSMDGNDGSMGIH